MRATSAAVQGALAVVGLTAAYLTWQREPELNKGEVVLLDVSKKALQKVRFEDGERWLELFRLSETEQTVWLRQGVLEGAKRNTEPDGGVAPLPPVRQLRGNERADKLFERFAPLRAARAFGRLPDAKRQEVGLVDGKRKLEVTAGGVTHLLKLGSAPQGGLPFAQDEQGRDFLLGASLLSELDPASQVLVDRRLHQLRLGEVDELTVRSEGKERRFIQTSAAQGGPLKIAPKDQPDRVDDRARNWHERAFSQLTVTQLYGRGEDPPGGAPVVAVRVDYQKQGASKGFLELARSGSETVARTEHTAGWVRVGGNMDELIAEASKLVTKEP